MKKYIGIAVALICALALTACGNNRKITLPEAENIAEIEIVKNISESGTKISEQDEISTMIRVINENTKNTGKESVSDQPVNIEDYIIIKFHHKNAEGSPSVAYLYHDKGKGYIEQPYSGIWNLDEEVFDSIRKRLSQ